MPPYALAVIGCSKRNLALADAALACGLTVSACVDASESRAKRAATRLGAMPLKRMEEALALSDILLLAPAPKDGDGAQHEPFACSNRRDSVLLTYNDFPFHAGLNQLARQVRAGGIGAPGFFRIRLTTTPDRFDDAPREVVGWLLRAADDPVRSFAQRVERGKRAAQLIATLTLSDGAIAQINISAQRGATQRIEAEVVGTEGLLAYDSRDEVFALHPPAAARGSLDSLTAHGFWRLFLDVIDDPDFTTRAVAERTLRIKRVLRRIARSVSSGKPVSIEVLGA